MLYYRVIPFTTTSDMDEHIDIGLSQNEKILRQVFFSWERGDQV